MLLFSPSPFLGKQTATSCFRRKKRWRLSDFKTIRFADEGYAIIIDSGDTGKIVFEYQGEDIWQE